MPWAGGAWGTPPANDRPTKRHTCKLNDARRKPQVDAYETGGGSNRERCAPYPAAPPHLFARAKLGDVLELYRNGGNPEIPFAKTAKGADLIEKRCLYCGKKYLAKTKRSRFCSDKCRTYANREMVVVSTVPNAITADTIARNVVALRGDLSFFDVAAERGPVKYRKACRDICDSTLEKLREWGV